MFATGSSMLYRHPRQRRHPHTHPHPHRRPPGGNYSHVVYRAYAFFERAAADTEAVAALVSRIIGDEKRAEALGRVVEADSSLTELADGSGKRVIDLACAPVRKAMQAALYLVSRFEVRAN